MIDDAAPFVQKPRLAQRAASGAFWLALEMAITQAISLFTFAIIARFVAPSDFGLINIAYLAVYAFKFVVIDAIALAVVRKRHATDIEYDTCFWTTLVFGVLGALLLFVLAGPAEQLMGASHLANVMRAMSIIVLFFGLARTHEMKLMRDFQFRALVFRGTFGAAMGGIIGIAMAVFGYGLSALVIQQVATSAISLALLWTTSPWVPSLQISRRTVVEIIAMMRTVLPTSVAGVTSQSCDTLLVAYFFGTESAGLYALSKRLRLALQSMVATPINSVSLSTLAEVQDDPERLKKTSLQFVSLISCVCAPIFIGSSSIASQILRIGFGEQWTAAGPIFAILTLGGLLATLQSFADTIFILKNRQIWTFYNLMIYIAISLSFFIFMRSSEIKYLAIPFIAPYLVTLSLSTALAVDLLSLSFLKWIAAIFPAMISSILMYFILGAALAYLAGWTDLQKALLCCPLGALIYVSTMFVLDREAILSIIRTARSFIS